MTGRGVKLINAELEVRDADDHVSGEYWVMSRFEAIGLRDRLDGWLAATVGALGNESPCPGSPGCAGSRPWFDREDELAGTDEVGGVLRCELCGGTVEF